MIDEQRIGEKSRNKWSGVERQIRNKVALVENFKDVSHMSTQMHSPAYHTRSHTSGVKKPAPSVKKAPSHKKKMKKKSSTKKKGVRHNKQKTPSTKKKVTRKKRTTKKKGKGKKAKASLKELEKGTREAVKEAVLEHKAAVEEKKLEKPPARASAKTKKQFMDVSAPSSGSGGIQKGGAHMTHYIVVDEAHIPVHMPHKAEVIAESGGPGRQRMSRTLTNPQVLVAISKHITHHKWAPKGARRDVTLILVPDTAHRASDTTLKKAAPGARSESVVAFLRRHGHANLIAELGIIEA